MEDKIAIFYDIENLIGGYTGLSDKNTRENLSLKKIIDSIKYKTKSKNIFIQRAYADWTAIKTFNNLEYDMSFIKKQVLDLGIEPVQVYTLGRQEKDVSDIKLVVDAMDVLYTREFINTFVIISGDGGYISLVKRLKESGKKTIMASYEYNKSPFLVANCDDYILLYDPYLDEDELIQYLNNLPSLYGKKNNPLLFTNQDILDIFIDIKNKFVNFPKQEDLSIKHYKLLSENIEKIFNPKIDYNRFGFPNQRSFMQNLLNETNLVVAKNSSNKSFICNKNYLKSKKGVEFIKKPDDIYKYLIKDKFNSFNFDMDQLKEMFYTIDNLNLLHNEIDFIVKKVLEKNATLTQNKIESFIRLSHNTSLLSFDKELKIYTKEKNTLNLDDFLSEVKVFFKEYLQNILNPKDIKENLDFLKILTTIS